MERRRFLTQLGLVTAAMPALARAAAAQAQAAAGQAAGQAADSAPPQGQESMLSGSGNIGTLRDPSVAGRAQTPTDPRENNLAIQQVEQRRACSCGCTLDVFTCRTTDFTCTYSPAMHREVLALWAAGKRGQEIVDAFVAKYGEKVLMAPKPRGFNLAGYLVPSVGLITASGGLLAMLLRRRRAVAASTAGSEGRPAPPGEAAASPEDLERLRRALAEFDD